MRVALLRGINVGAHRKVPMVDLRAACTDAVVRTSDELRTALDDHHRAT